MRNIIMPLAFFLAFFNYLFAATPVPQIVCEGDSNCWRVENNQKIPVPQNWDWECRHFAYIDMQGYKYSDPDYAEELDFKEGYGGIWDRDNKRHRCIAAYLHTKEYRKKNPGGDLWGVLNRDAFCRQCLGIINTSWYNPDILNGGDCLQFCGRSGVKKPAKKPQDFTLEAKSLKFGKNTEAKITLKVPNSSPSYYVKEIEFWHSGTATKITVPVNKTVQANKEFSPEAFVLPYLGGYETWARGVKLNNSKEQPDKRGNDFALNAKYSHFRCGFAYDWDKAPKGNKNGREITLRFSKGVGDNDALIKGKQALPYTCELKLDDDSRDGGLSQGGVSFNPTAGVSFKSFDAKLFEVSVDNLIKEQDFQAGSSSAKTLTLSFDDFNKAILKVPKLRGNSYGSSQNVSNADRLNTWGGNENTVKMYQSFMLYKAKAGKSKEEVKFKMAQSSSFFNERWSKDSSADQGRGSRLCPGCAQASWWFQGTNDSTVNDRLNRELRENKPLNLTFIDSAKVKADLRNINFGKNTKAKLYLYPEDIDGLKGQFSGEEIEIKELVFAPKHEAAKQIIVAIPEGKKKIKTRQGQNKSDAIDLPAFVLPYLGEYIAWVRGPEDGHFIRIDGSSMGDTAKTPKFFLDARLDKVYCGYAHSGTSNTEIALFYSPGGHKFAKTWGSLPITCEFTLKDDSKGLRADDQDEYRVKLQPRAKQKIELKPKLSLDKASDAHLLDLKVSESLDNKSFFTKSDTGSWDLLYSNFNKAIKSIENNDKLKADKWTNADGVKLDQSFSIYKQAPNPDDGRGPVSLPEKIDFFLNAGSGEGVGGNNTSGSATGGFSKNGTSTPSTECESDTGTLSNGSHSACCPGCYKAAYEHAKTGPQMIKLAFYKPYLGERVSKSEAEKSMANASPKKASHKPGIDIGYASNDPAGLADGSGAKAGQFLFHKRNGNAKSDDSQEKIVGLFELFYFSAANKHDGLTGIWTNPLTGEKNAAQGVFAGYAASAEEILALYFEPASYLENLVLFKSDGVSYCVIREGVAKATGRAGSVTDAEFKACKESAKRSFYHKRSFEDNIKARPKRILENGALNLNPFAEQESVLSRFGRSPDSLEHIRDWATLE